MPRKSYALSPAEAARLFGTLGNETRVRLLLSLAGRGEAGVRDLAAAAGQGQPDTSYHLRLLQRGRLVVCRRDGQRTLYRLASPAAAAVLRVACGA